MLVIRTFDEIIALQLALPLPGSYCRAPIDIR